MNLPPNIAIVGVTGAVGQELLKLINERNFKFDSLKPLASKRSAGKKLEFQGKTYVIEELTEVSFEGIDITFFSAGGSISKKYAPIAGKKSIVIDNSSAFRMAEGIPLIIPEVNPHHLTWLDKLESKIIANPNCSTILMNLVVYPLHKISPVERVVVSTYQASSGAGLQAMKELEQQTKEYSEGKRGSKLTQDIFGRQYIFNLFSHNSVINLETGYNEEEIKMVKETKKIFDDNSIQITATCVRVPILRAHCESINLTFRGSLSESNAREIVSKAPGVSVADNREENRFPEPLMASGKDDIFVGRIRADISQSPGKGIEMFIAGDQIRKGAALNAIQIAELLIQRSIK